MTRSCNYMTIAGARLLAAAVLISTLAFASGAVMAAESDAHEDRAELRIKDMHGKLKITPAQEAQWAKVAEVMRNNGKAMDALTETRLEHAKVMSAVDDLKSYAEIAKAQTDGINEFIPVFAEFYNGMSDVQKKAADELFRHGEGKHGMKTSLMK